MSGFQPALAMVYPFVFFYWLNVMQQFAQAVCQNKRSKVYAINNK